MHILMSLPDAAHIYGVRLPTLRRWLSEGRLVRHGSTKPYKVDASEVEQLVSCLRGKTG